MATGVGVSSCCLSGKIATGSPTGIVEEIGTLKTYVAAPQDGSKKKAIILITDIFGYEAPNVRLLADEYAKAGFYALVPDVLESDPIAIEFLQTIEAPLPEREKMSLSEKAAATAMVGATLGPWLIKHREAVAKPIIDGFIQAIRHTPGVDKLGVIGFCWGGRYAILAAHETSPNRAVDAAYACHPSLVGIPGDFDPIKKPTSLALGDKDSLLGEKEVKQIQELLGKKADVETEVKVYPDQVHGFALRGDWSSEKDKKALDDATAQGIAWFNKHLS